MLIESVNISCFSEAKNNEKKNQDAILIPKEIDGGIIFGIADGVGGYLGAEEASQIVINTLAKRNRITQQDIDNIFYELREKVSNLSLVDPKLQQAATTLSFCYLCIDGIHIGHIGDCRIYFKNNRKLEQITTDHTQHQKLLSLGIYTKKEISKLPGKNLITTAISKKVNMVYDKIFISWDDIKKNNHDDYMIIYIMSDGAYHFWDKRKRFSEKTMNDVNKFSVSLKNRIRQSPVDDYSLIGIQFKMP